MTLRFDKARSPKKNASKIAENLNNISNLPRDIHGIFPDVQRFILNRRQLHRIFTITKRSLNDLNHLNVFPLQSEIMETLNILQEGSLRPPAIVLLGAARARLVNFLLKENLLPVIEQTKGWRWLRILYGKRRQVSLSLGMEFEVVEQLSLASMSSSWEQIPHKDLRRNHSLDLQTVMEIELNNPFLKNGLQILIPPDLGELSLDTRPPNEFMHQTTLKDYETFYTKRSYILESVFPIVMYALDDIGSAPSEQSRESYLENIKEKEYKVGKSTTFYLDSKTDNEMTESIESLGITFETKVEMDNCEDYVKDVEEALKFHYKNKNNQQADLTEENLLDLRQIYEIHPNVKILAVLFSDSGERKSKSELKLPLSLKINRKGSNSNSSSNNVHNESPSFFDNCSLSTSTEMKANDMLSSGLSISPLSDRSANEKFYDIDNACEVFELTKEVNTAENIPPENLLQKQLTFLDKLMEQINVMSTLYSGKKSNSQFLIVDDTENEIEETKPQETVDVSSKQDVIVHRKKFLELFFHHAKDCLQSYVLDDCDKINEIHNTLLQQFIISSFDMAREMQIIPKKIDYVVKMEQQLYSTLLSKFTEGEKREELLTIMNKVLKDVKNDINSLDWATGDPNCHNSSECINMDSSKSIFYDTSKSIEDPNEPTTSKVDLDDDSIAPFNLKEYDIITIESESTPSIAESQSASMSYNTPMNMSFKQASLEVQKAVLARISRNISIQLVYFVDCLKDSYFGTLQRCVESLEEGRGRKTASEAVRRILLVTRSIDLQHCASFSFLNALIDSLKRLFHKLSLTSRNNTSCCVQSIRWKRQVAIDTVESLSSTKLARLISNQLCNKIRVFHEQFQSALHSLGNHLESHLQQTEELKLNLRKLHAPKFARLYLESTSLGDTVRYGLPRMGKEIGRGQYGVVFSVKGSWGNHTPCAVKSVVPPDERHFNELAMEFFQTRNIPPHDRIVRLFGCVIDHSYSGTSPAVLLVSQRLKSDLHYGLLEGNLSFYQRMQIAIDIVEGIRYLHSQGLVHRDIKMKNVLLDEQKRAKLTDLGFCLPEAMMSGSIVGTPVHMAPELFSGVYDGSVDVYAFGILFWYLCSGSVRMPYTFEKFSCKEQLWTHVIKGIRPERLPEFSSSCWDLMEKCWATNASDRPLLGVVQPVLENIRDKSV